MPNWINETFDWLQTFPKRIRVRFRFILSNMLIDNKIKHLALIANRIVLMCAEIVHITNLECRTFHEEII